MQRVFVGAPSLSERYKNSSTTLILSQEPACLRSFRFFLLARGSVVSNVSYRSAGKISPEMGPLEGRTMNAFVTDAHFRTSQSLDRPFYSFRKRFTRNLLDGLVLKLGCLSRPFSYKTPHDGVSEARFETLFPRGGARVGLVPRRTRAVSRLAPQSYFTSFINRIPGGRTCEMESCQRPLRTARNRAGGLTPRARRLE